MEKPLKMFIPYSWQDMDVLLGVIVCLHQNILVERGKAYRQDIRGTVFQNMWAKLYPWKYWNWDLFSP